MLRGWIGVDFDGTLATYDPGTVPLIGKPIPEMVARIQRWIKDGIEVRIVTARASHPDFTGKQAQEIEAWCFEHLGFTLPITCIKDYDMIELWDDRVVQVETNTGNVIGISRLGFK